MKIFTKIAAVFFTVFAVVHILRLVEGWPVQVGGIVVPLGASYVIAGVAAVMAWGLWRESR